MKVSQWKAVCEMQPTEFAPLGLRGIMAKHKIDSSDTIVRIPMNLLVTRETAISFLEQSNLFCSSLHIFNQTTTLELLAMFLLINKMSVKLSIKCDQFWKPYIDTLPESYEVPYFCNDDEVNVFPPYLKIQAFEQKNKVWKSFTKTSSLVKKYSNIELNHDEYAWAWFTVNTRAVYFKTSNSKQNGLDAHQTDLGDDQENLALAPFLDLFNHSSMANVEAGLNLQSK